MYGSTSSNLQHLSNPQGTKLAIIISGSDMVSLILNSYIVAVKYFPLKPGS